MAIGCLSISVPAGFIGLGIARGHRRCPYGAEGPECALSERGVRGLAHAPPAGGKARSESRGPRAAQGVSGCTCPPLPVVPVGTGRPGHSVEMTKPLGARLAKVGMMRVSPAAAQRHLVDVNAVLQNVGSGFSSGT